MVGNELRNCLLQVKSNRYWHEFANITTLCVEKYSTLRIDRFLKFKMGRFGEIKYFLPIDGDEKNDDKLASSRLKNCNFLTIGIGGDVNVEKEFHQKYAQCKIYGIEPSADQTAGFDKYGTVIPFAVGETFFSLC